MSLFIFLTKFIHQLRLVIIVLLTLFLHQNASAQTATVLHVDGDNGLANGDGETWGTAYKYLQDALTEAELLLIDDPATPVHLWVAATDPSNPYTPDRSAANHGGNGEDESATFLLDFNNITILGGFVGGINGETDPLERNPELNVTVLSGSLATIPVCGSPSSGSCFLPNGNAACADADCCEAVCALDPNCCNVEWDQGCADLAFSVCGTCGDSGAGSCSASNGTPGCDDADCCAMSLPMCLGFTLVNESNGK